MVWIINKFFFIVAPSVSVPNQLVGIPVGSTVMLDCHLESSPLALHFWNREDGLVLHESAKYRMQSLTGPSAAPTYKTHLRLAITNVTSQDYGSYRCVAKNPFGEADGVIKLYRKSHRLHQFTEAIDDHFR